MVTITMIAILIALLFGIKFLRSMVAILGMLIFNGMVLMSLFDGNASHIVAGLACCLFIVFLWIYAYGKDHNEHNELDELNSQRNSLT